jgi:hypothetical protein
MDSPLCHPELYHIMLYWNFLEQSKGARNRVGIGLSHRPARLRRLAESIT